MTKALEALSITPSPDLWLAIFDPDLGLEEALGGRYTLPNLINANGISSINLNQALRQSPDLPPTHYYGTFYLAQTQV